MFFAEGIRCLSQALEFGMHFDTLIYAPQLMDLQSSRFLISKMERMGIPTKAVSAEVFHSISIANNAQGIGAIVRQRSKDLRLLNPDDGNCLVALSHVQSPGNMGTIVRTADAAGVGGFILIGEQIDPYEPGTVRASMGSLFAQKFVRTSMRDFAAWKSQHQCFVVGATPGGGRDYHEFTYPGRTVLFIGSERKGLSEEELSHCDELVRIPMVGKLDSLNVAIATSILLYEIYNQRRANLS